MCVCLGVAARSASMPSCLCIGNTYTHYNVQIWNTYTAVKAERDKHEEKQNRPNVRTWQRGYCFWIHLEYKSWSCETNTNCERTYNRIQYMILLLTISRNVACTTTILSITAYNYYLCESIE